MSAEQDAAAVRLAYARLFSDNPAKGDAFTVLSDMARASGFFGVPSIASWIAETGAAAGYEANCAELNGKRALYARVSSFAALSEDDMIRLERVARLGRFED